MNTRIYFRLLVIISLLSILMNACSTPQESSPVPSIQPMDTETPNTPAKEIPTRELPEKIEKLTPVAPIEKEPIDMTPISPADLPANMQDIVNQAISALAEKLGIANEKIQVISAESVVWSDSSLGCPQPGMNYLMVLTDGYRIVLAVDDQPYYYHANQRGYGLLCESPSPPYSQGAVDR